MADKKTDVAARVRDAVAGLIEGAGYKLWDVAYYKEGPEMILEISIDREGGISLNDCSAVTKLIEPLIDEMDPIEESYCLQVSSAGVVRPLNRDEHIRFVSESRIPVTVGLYTATDGKKEFSGMIEEYDGTDIVLESGGERRTFNKKQISRITAEFNEAAVEGGYNEE